MIDETELDFEKAYTGLLKCLPSIEEQKAAISIVDQMLDKGVPLELALDLYFFCGDSIN